MGERTSRTNSFEEAIAILTSALEIRRRELFPQDWALTHYNIGRALLDLGRIDSDPVKLGEAVSNFRDSLSVWSSDQQSEEYKSASADYEKAVSLINLNSHPISHN